MSQPYLEPIDERIHLFLMEHVDGDHAERFAASCVNPPQGHVPETQQIQWAVNYWVNQIANNGHALPPGWVGHFEVAMYRNWERAMTQYILPLIDELDIPKAI